jgi:hypothetical protein
VLSGGHLASQPSPKYVDVLTWIVGRTPNAAQKANRRPDLRRLAQYVGAIVCALLHRNTTANNLDTIVGVPDEVRDLENLFKFVVIYLIHWMFTKLIMNTHKGFVVY